MRYLNRAKKKKGQGVPFHTAGAWLYEEFRVNFPLELNCLKK